MIITNVDKDSGVITIKGLDFSLLNFLISPNKRALKETLSPFHRDDDTRKSYFDLSQTQEPDILMARYWIIFCHGYDEVVDFLSQIEREDVIEVIEDKFSTDFGSVVVFENILNDAGIPESKFIEYASPKIKDMFDITKFSYHYGSGSYVSENGKKYYGQVSIFVEIIFYISIDVIISFFEENREVKYKSLLEKESVKRNVFRCMSEFRSKK